MLPQEVLKVSIEDIKKSIPKVYYPKREHPDTSVVSFYKKLKQKDKTAKREITESYTHRTYVTKKYRDKGCAAFVLIKFFEEITRNAKFVFIRVEPKIKKEMDSNKDYKQWRGVVRLSVSSQAKTI